MVKFKLACIAIFSLLLTSTFQIANAANSGNAKSNQAPKTNMNSIALTMSKWIAPTIETSTAAIVVKSGSSIPVQFQLSDGTREITSGAPVLTSTAAACPASVPSPAPSSRNVTSQSKPGKSAASDLRYLGKNWKAIWKTDKSAEGCFKLTASMTVNSTTYKVDSPVFFAKK